MEEAILGVLNLELLDGCGPAMCSHTDQMMPVKDLMKNDTVRKPSKSQAENDTCPDQR